MSQHPLVGARIIEAKGKGAQIILVDPRRSQISRFADLHLKHKPGSDVALINGMMKCILDHGLENESFISERREDFDRLKEVLDALSLDEVEKISGVAREEIEKAALTYAEAEASCII